MLRVLLAVFGLLALAPVLAQGETDSSERIEELTGRLETAEDYEVRCEILEAIGELGPGAVAAVPALITALGDEDEEVRQAAAVALGAVGRQAGPAVSALVASLEDEDEDVRDSALDALGAIGSKVAVSPLLSALRSGDVFVQAKASHALARIGPPSVSGLISALGDGSGRTRASAAKALGEIGAEASSGVPSLVALFDDQEQGVRDAAVGALDGVGPAAVGGLLELHRRQEFEAVTLLNEDGSVWAVSVGEDESVWQYAEKALLSMGTRAVPALITNLGAEDPRLREAAADTLFELGDDAEPAVPALAKAALDEDQAVRGAVIAALGGLGPKAASAVPALIEALCTTSDRFERLSVVEALADIEANTNGQWWVLPRAYSKQLCGLLLALFAWFALMARFPRHRPSNMPKHLLLVALTAAVPMALACGAVHYAITRDWAQGFLPDAVTVVPFPVAAILSAAFVCGLVAIWVCQRKPLQPAEQLRGLERPQSPAWGSV